MRKLFIKYSLFLFFCLTFSTLYSQTLAEKISSINKKLSLQDLDRNKNDTEIRIWINYSLSDSGKLIIIKKVKDNWVGTLSLLKYFTTFNEVENELTLDSITKINIVKDSGFQWGKLFSLIQSSNFKTYEKINNYKLVTGGDAIAIEIANWQSYSIVHYPDYSLFGNKNKVKGLNKLLDNLKKAFVVEIEKSNN